jgi:hypothetical protein
MPRKNAFTYFLFLIGLNCLLGRLLGMFLPIYFQEIGLSGVATGVYFSI